MPELAISPLEQFAANLELRAALPPEDREAILALRHTLRRPAAATYLVEEGERPEVCAVLLKGFAYRQKMTGEGSRQIVALHIPGDALDLQNLFLDMSDHSVQMLTDGEVALIPRGELQQLAKSRAAISHALLVKILVEASIFREWILNVGQRNAFARTSHLLCEIAVRLNAHGLAEDYGYRLPMTQQQLGDALGLTPVHVNRTIKALEAAGLVARTKDRGLSFPDWRKLVEAGDFSDRYLHLQRQSVA